MDFVQHIINGLLQGCILALIGLGFSLVWGILNIINLAHAAFIMLAAYLTYFLWSVAGIDPFITLPISMAVLFAGGYLLQRYVINLVMGASILTTFLLTFGFESLVGNLAPRLFSGRRARYQALLAHRVADPRAAVPAVYPVGGGAGGAAADLPAVPFS